MRSPLLSDEEKKGAPRFYIIEAWLRKKALREDLAPYTPLKEAY